MDIGSISSITNLGISTDPSILDKQVKLAENNKDDEALKKVCREFEAILLSKMFKEMKKTVPDGGLIEKSLATEIFEEMYIDELSNEITEKSSLGLAEMLYEQFKKGYVSW
jgi:flagellar protein FlgJ